MLITVIIVGIAVFLVARWMEEETKQYRADQKELEKSIQALIDSIEQSRQVLTKRR